MKIRQGEAELFRTDGRTEMKKLIVALCNFAYAPKNQGEPHGRGLQPEMDRWEIPIYFVRTTDVKRLKRNT